MRIVPVNFDSQAPTAQDYDILIGGGILDQLGPMITERNLAKPAPLVIISDDQVGPLYIEKVRAALSACWPASIHEVIIPAGEASKDLHKLPDCLEKLLACHLERNSLLVALGGGVVGDLAGFAAAILLRGLGFIQVPTSLLAQIDSSVGGKTGVNSATGKNLIGSFHQPRLVVADTDTLDSLPPREMRAGYAEMVKYGVIDDLEFFEWLEVNGQKLLDGDQSCRIEAISRCCAAKARIVAADERENNQRALLNLGHTFGHALEAAVGFGQALLHGEAVAIGMVLALKFSAGRGLCSMQDGQRVERHLAAAGLPTRLSDIPQFQPKASDMVDLMRSDKKVEQGTPRLILCRGIGQSFIEAGVTLSDLHEFWTQEIEAIN